MSKKKSNKTKLKGKSKIRTKKIVQFFNQRQSLIGLGIVLLFSFLVLSPLLNGDFLNYDDDIYITNNPYIANLNFEGINKLFTEIFANQYAPISYAYHGFRSQNGWNAGSLGTKPI